MISSAYAFLAALKENNNRSWFLKHATEYEEARKSVSVLFDRIIGEMRKSDLIETPGGVQSMRRIYRDLRFSRDQSPYKIYFAGRIKRATPDRRGGYYYHLQPGNTYLTGGFLGPQKDDLKRIRDEIAGGFDEFHKIIDEPGFVRTFGSLEGDKLKKAPRGYSPDLPGIEYIKMKQFYVRKFFTDKQCVSRGFPDKVVNAYRKMRPFFDYMSWVLTTDSNGAPLL